MDSDLTPQLATESLDAAGVGGRVRSVARLDGGVSNLTWRVDREGADPVVLRLQRERGIFQPYDILREARVIACLEASPIPVPRVLGTAGAESPLGAPFAVLSWLDFPHMGQTAMTAGVIVRYRSMVESIHSLDWRALGLGFLDPPSAGPEAAQRDLDAVHARAVDFSCADDPQIARLAGALQANLPDSPEPMLCHGDINVFNYLVGPDDQIAGVVDWEQAHLGDPLSEWGLITALGSLRGIDAPPEAQPLAAPALQRSGRRASDLRYWMLHQMYKLAVIHCIWSQIGDEPPWYTWADVERVSAHSVSYLLDSVDL